MPTTPDSKTTPDNLNPVKPAPTSLLAPDSQGVRLDFENIVPNTPKYISSITDAPTKKLNQESHAERLARRESLQAVSQNLFGGR